MGVRGLWNVSRDLMLAPAPLSDQLSSLDLVPNCRDSLFQGVGGHGGVQEEHQWLVHTPCWCRCKVNQVTRFTLVPHLPHVLQSMAVSGLTCP